MSKKLLYLLTLICSISLFTACSDDDDEKKEEEVDNSWEQVVGDYNGEKLTFSYGETTLTGKEVKFSATNGTNGSLLLKNRQVRNNQGKHQFGGLQLPDLPFPHEADSKDNQQI